MVVLNKVKLNIRNCAGALVVGISLIVIPLPVLGQNQSTTTHQSSMPQVAVGSQGDWALPNLDLHGSRYADFDGINTPNVDRVALAWTFEAGPTNSITQVTPLVIYGDMYLNAGGTLYEVNAATGESIWTMTMEDTLEARGRGPSYGDGKLYACLLYTSPSPRDS